MSTQTILFGKVVVGQEVSDENKEATHKYTTAKIDTSSTLIVDSRTRWSDGREHNIHTFNKGGHWNYTTRTWKHNSFGFKATPKSTSLYDNLAFSVRLLAKCFFNAGGRISSSGGAERGFRFDIDIFGYCVAELLCMFQCCRDIIRKE